MFELISFLAEESSLIDRLPLLTIAAVLFGIAMLLLAIRMKKLEISLKCFGVLIAIVGFYVSQAEQSLCLLRIISPKYVHGIKGLRTLGTEKVLIPSDDGFSELDEIIMRQQKEANPLKDFSAIQVEKFKITGDISTVYKGNKANMLIPVCFDLSDGSGGPETIGSLQIWLEQIRMKNIFKWTTLLLFTGIGFVEIPSIVIQWRKGTKV